MKSLNFLTTGKAMKENLLSQMSQLLHGYDRILVFEKFWMDSAAFVFEV
jgi:hypothetical protein